MSGENIQLQTRTSGALPDEEVVLPDGEMAGRMLWGGTMWLELVGVIARTVDDDYAPCPYPVLVEVEPERAESVPAEPVSQKEEQGRASQSVSEAASSVPEESAKTKTSMPPPSPWGPIMEEKHPRRRRRRSRKSRSVGTERGSGWKVSLAVSLAVVIGGGWLILRDSPRRVELTEEELAAVRVPVAAMPKSVAEEVNLQAPKVEVAAPQVVRPVDINSLTLAQVGDTWEAAEGEWTAEPVLVLDTSAAPAKTAEAAGPVVTPINDGSRPAPSAAFLSYAATLRITSVAWGKRVRAKINGATYVEDAELEPRLGVRLVGRDPEGRALIFESSDRSRVKVSY